MLEYRIIARSLDAHISEATCKNARLDLDTDPQGRLDAFNPVEFLLVAIAACMIKNIERVAPLFKLEIRGVEVGLHGTRQDSPPKMTVVTYELIVGTHADDHKLDLLHQNVRKYGTIYNTVAEAPRLEGRVIRCSIARP